MNAPRDSLPFFVYGTLLDPDVMRVVSGLDRRRLRCEPARILGRRVAPVRGVAWPTLVPAAGAARGLIYHDLPPEARARIAFFEGDVYRLETGPIAASSGRSLPCGFYVADTDRAAPGAWTLDAWRRAFKTTALPWIQAEMKSFDPALA